VASPLRVQQAPGTDLYSALAGADHVELRRWPPATAVLAEAPHRRWGPW
jgi:hypothetical protein